MSDPGGFDLVGEPWLLTRSGAGVTERSLLEAFEEAHHIGGLAGEIPTQEIALLRVLLVVLRRSLPYARNAAEARRQWAELWEVEALPLELISAYLDEHRERFDLFSPATPFMQVADLQANKTSGLTKLIAEAPDGHPYFTTRSARANEELTPAEAGRWLVHCQAFDPSGIKTGAHGDVRVKGGKGYPIGTGWAGRCGVVVVEGTTLKETLLLNLPMGQGNPGDRPVWERSPQSAAIDSGHPHPTGPCDILTWQVRRVRLIRDGDGVGDALISNGDPIQWYNQHAVEPMSAWRRSKAQETKNKVPVAYMPQAADPDRAMWRGLNGLLVERAATSGHDAASTMPPRSLQWIAELQDSGVLGTDHAARVRTVGMEYGGNESTTASVVDDGLTLRLSVLTNERLNGLVKRSLEDADGAVSALAALARNLSEASGFDPDSVRAAGDRARRRGYVELDRGYRRWVASLSSESDHEERQTAWQRFVYNAIRRLGGELVNEAGSGPLRGGLRRKAVDVGLAQAWFEAALRKRLPLAALEQVTISTPEAAHA